MNDFPSDNLQTSSRRSGRPRLAEIDQAILENTLSLLIKQGYKAMSIEAIAEAAGVTKPTIYRRYPSKRELVAAALVSLVEGFELPPDSGNVRQDMLVYFQQLFSSPQNYITSIIGAMFISEREEPQLMELIRKKIIQPRMDLARELFSRGVKQGVLRPEIDVPLVAQMVLGAFVVRHLSGYPENMEWLEQLVDTLFRGLANRD